MSDDIPISDAWAHPEAPPQNPSPRSPHDNALLKRGVEGETGLPTTEYLGWARKPGGATEKGQDVDLISVLSQCFAYDIPVVNLHHPTGLKPLPGTPANLYRSYTLGMGRTCVLELHQLGESELSGLAAQGQEPKSRFVALKRMVDQSATSEPVGGGPGQRGNLRSMRQELRVFRHRKLRVHENVTDLLFVGIDDDELPVLALELATYGNLEDVILSRALRSNSTLAHSLVLDVAAGIEALHTAGFAHGDLKPGNVLVFTHPIRGAVAKLADFADAVDVEDLLRGAEWQPLGGTHAWRAPECYGPVTEKYSPLKTDVYSFGLCALAVLVHGEDHDGEESGRQAICFLQRHALEVKSGNHLAASQQVSKWKKDSNDLVVGLAGSWINANYKGLSWRTFQLARLLASACLRRDPRERLDAVALRGLITENIGEQERRQ
jgi:serine/threonine protein kinase